MYRTRVGAADRVKVSPETAEQLSVRNGVSAVAGVVFFLLSCWAGLYTWFVAGMTCDDTCASSLSHADWTQHGDSAEWTELGRLAGVNLLLVLLSSGLLLTGRRWVAWLALLLVLLHGAASVRMGELLDEANKSGGSVWGLATAMGLLMVVGALFHARRS